MYRWNTRITSSSLQRAHANSHGVVTKVGRALIASNCYMNSLLQQLYMMPQFRYCVWLASPHCPLTRELKDAEDKAREARGEVLDAKALEAEKAANEGGEDELLYQLQLMFTFLSQSEKQFYDTAPFCFSYKDERGHPINVRVQQDAQEFFNVLLDRLEKKLMSPTSPHSPRLPHSSHPGFIWWDSRQSTRLSFLSSRQRIP